MVPQLAICLSESKYGLFENDIHYITSDDFNNPILLYNKIIRWNIWNQLLSYIYRFWVANQIQENKMLVTSPGIELGALGLLV